MDTWLFILWQPSCDGHMASYIVSDLML